MPRHRASSPSLGASLHPDPVGTRRPVANAVLKSITWNAGIDREALLLHVEHVHLVVAVQMDFPDAILVEEVVGHHEPLVVVREMDGVRSRVLPEADDGDLRELLRIREMSSITT